MTSASLPGKPVNDGPWHGLVMSYGPTMKTIFDVAQSGLTVGEIIEDVET